MKKSPEQIEEMNQRRNDRIQRQYRGIRKMQKRVYWGLVLHLAVAAVALTWFAHIASQPTGDELFQSKYCTLLNARHPEESKVWSCPRVEWR